MQGSGNETVLTSYISVSSPLSPSYIYGDKYKQAGFSTVPKGSSCIETHAPLCPPPPPPPSHPPARVGMGLMSEVLYI